jgi:CHAT domain-containing protein
VRGRLPEYPILHLATHGVLDAAPLQSFVALAGGDVLSVYELFGLDLTGTELVVLSACESGGGSVTAGDEVLGPTRGLLAAGATAVIVSLWNVSDASAPLLMLDLYRRLCAGEPPVQALGGAQQRLRTLSAEAAAADLADLRAAAERAGHPVAAGDLPADLSHPRHWAPFTLVGL